METQNHKGLLMKMIKFFKAQAQNSNEKEACKKVKEQARLLWVSAFGETLTEFKNLLSSAVDRFKSLDKQLAQAETKLHNTDKFIPSPYTANQQIAQKTSIKDWSFKDITLMILTVTGAIACAILGKNNLEANLLASGNVLFIERPDMAKALSWILPLSALALKFITNTLENDRYKLYYTRVINFILLILVLVWSWLFAENFPGITSEFDLDSLLEGGGTGTWLVWTQLLIELLSGTALFLAAERIYLKYSGDHYWNNPLHPELKKSVRDIKTEHQAILTEISKLHGKIEAKEADRDAFINQAESEFIAFRAQFKSVQNPQFS